MLCCAVFRPTGADRLAAQKYPAQGGKASAAFPLPAGTTPLTAAKTPHRNRLTQVAGWLLLAMVLLSVAHGLGAGIPRLWAGLAAWTAGLMLFSRVAPMLRLQVVAMGLLGLVGMTWSWQAGGDPRLEAAVSGNQSLLAMLAAVSFLRLVAQPEAATDESLPHGRRALWRTLFGVHLFGAVINLSAITIVGDRLSARRALTSLQALSMSRGFTKAAHWSPFFAAMAVALTNAPGAQLTLLASIGLPLALAALLIGGWLLNRQPAITGYAGYPMHFGALWMPSLLALAVMLLHHRLPGLPILTLISLLSVAFSVALVLLRDAGRGARKLAAHVAQVLPRMAGELSLFLAAAVLAAGIGALVEALELTPGITQFGAWQASLLLLIMIGLATIGIHPVISIASAGSLLAPLHPDPNLLAMTFLMSWALGVSSSPFSAIHLALQGRYGVSAYALARRNIGFVLVMLCLEVLALHLYASLAA